MTTTVNRRAVFRFAAASAVAAVPASQAAAMSFGAAHDELAELTATDLRQMLDDREISSAELVDACLGRIDAIDQHGPTLNAMLELSPDAHADAVRLDNERRAKGPRGLIHGLPVVLKDNIDTADRMHTTAGSRALLRSTPPRDATVVRKLREAGAVILGKTNLSEWANMRSSQASSGWSGRGGQTQNPYGLGRSPSGSSAGSAVAVSAGLAPLALGSETNGSIISPASMCGVAAIKPTVGVTSRAGVIPISRTQDSVGAFGRSVADVALALGRITGVDRRDKATLRAEAHVSPNYTMLLDAGSLKGVRLGIPRNVGWTDYSPEADAVFASCVDALLNMGAVIIDNADIATADQLAATPGPFDRLLYEFKRDIATYLANRNDPEFQTLADLIAFNKEHAAEEMPYFGQDIFEMSDATEDDEAWYAGFSQHLFELAGPKGIDATLAQHDLDALIAPGSSPAPTIDVVNGEKFLGGSTSVSATAGYPIVTVPAGYAYGLPVGLNSLGTAFSEQRLLNFAYAFEQATQMRRPPQMNGPELLPGGSNPLIELPQVDADLPFIEPQGG